VDTFKSISGTERYFSTSVFGATTHTSIYTYGLARNYKALLRKEAGLKMGKGKKERKKRKEKKKGKKKKERKKIIIKKK